MLPNPEAAAIGRVAKAALGKSGIWEDLAAKAITFKPTVNDLANDLKLGSADASILWDATVRQYPEIEALPGIWFGSATASV